MRRFVLSFAPAVAVHCVVLLGLSTLARPAVSVHSGDVLYVTVVPAKVEARPDPVREAALAPAPQEPRPLPPAAKPRPKQRLTRVAEPMVTEPAIDPETPAVPAAEPGPTTPIRPETRPPAAVAPEVPPAPSGGASVKARPRYRSNPRPDYPVSALRHRAEGVVLLDVDVTADGRAATVTLERGSGFDELDKAALETVKGWTFEPARVDGKPIASQVEVPVRFSLDGR